MKPAQGFPAHVIHPDRELFRVHRAIHGPFHFAAAGELGSGGRFDLPAGTGQGTCYLATSPIGALLETFGRFRVVTHQIVEERRLTVAVPTAPLRLADLTDRRTLGRYGITGDVSTGGDYVPTQRWAVRLWEAAFDGVYYAARHDPQFTERSVAVFGTADDDHPTHHKLFDVDTTAIPGALLDQLAEEFGILVIPAAPATDADVLPGW